MVVQDIVLEPSVGLVVDENCHVSAGGGMGFVNKIRDNCELKLPSTRVGRRYGVFARKTCSRGARAARSDCDVRVRFSN